MIESIVYILVIIFSVVLHEVSHGVIAYSLGDPTAKNAGRLTLNPLPHLDLFGSVLLPILTYQFGFIFGYAKPVPYNPLNLSDRKYGPAKVALAGPVSNIILAVLFGLTLRFFGAHISYSMGIIFAKATILNLGLALFNLMPIQPLDGHWLLITFLPERFHEIKYFLARYNIFFFLIFVVFLFPYLMPLINFLFNVIVGR